MARKDERLRSITSRTSASFAFDPNVVRSWATSSTTDSILSARVVPNSRGGSGTNVYPPSRRLENVERCAKRPISCFGNHDISVLPCPREDTVLCHPAIYSFSYSAPCDMARKWVIADAGGTDAAVVENGIEWPRPNLLYSKNGILKTAPFPRRLPKRAMS